MMDPSPMLQYRPMDITTCCPAVDRRRSPRSMAPEVSGTIDGDDVRGACTILDDGLAAEDNVRCTGDGSFAGYLI